MLVKSRPKFITLGILGAMMALLIVGLFYTQGNAQAQEETVGTGAQVVNTGQPPVIECKWELPDMMPGYTGIDKPDPMIQYNDKDGNHDDSNARPNPEFPCDNPTDNDGNAIALPIQVQHATNMIQVRPLPHLDPSNDVPERYIQLWMAVDQPGGSLDAISDVYWDVLHPDGTFKVQVHGTRIGMDDAFRSSDHNNDSIFGTVNVGRTQRLITECSNIGSASAEGTMFHAAYATGQLSSSAIDDPDFGIISKCIQEVKAVYYAKFPLHKDQPCGSYEVQANAVSVPGGASDILYNHFDVLCFWYLDTDFDVTGLNWGNITPGQKNVISGDTAWDLGGPTVRNGSNHPMGIHISFSTLWGDQTPTPKKIDHFDACFGHNAFVIACLGSDGQVNAEGIPDDAILADEVVYFGPEIGGRDDGRHGNGPNRRADNGHQVLCANQMGKLDLSIHPGIDVTPGEYKGTFTIWGHTVHDNHMNNPVAGQDHPNNALNPSQDHCYQDQEHKGLDVPFQLNNFLNNPGDIP